MGKKYSDQDTDSLAQPNAAKKEPLVFVVSADRDHLEAVLARCAGVPERYAVYSNIDRLMEALAQINRLSIAFALIVDKNAENIDAPALRRCKLDYPQLHYLVLVETCSQPSYLRFESMGVQNILLPPFSNVDLRKEIATALPNIPQFKRHPGLGKHGRVRLDFLIPSDLSYVLGVNHLVSMLLKEFSFPPADCRINIPLACDEAITNAIIHGNGSDPEKKVSIQIYISASRIKLRIQDQGQGFDVSQVDNPTEGSALMRSSGRGVYLIKTIMDKVEYKTGGTVVELEKTNTDGNPNPPVADSTS